MKVTISRRDLLELLGKLSVAICQKHQLPILTSFLVKANHNEIVVTATDLEVELSGKCKAKVLETGEMILPPKARDFLKATTADQVTIEGTRKGTRVKTLSPEGMPQAKAKMDYIHTATLQAAKSSISLPSFDPKDYIPLRQVKGERLQFTGLLKAINDVAYARATDTIRPVLTCISLKQAKRGIAEVAGCDGFRLAVSTAKAKGKMPSQFLLPPTAIKVMQKLFGEKITLAAEEQGQADHATWFLRWESQGFTMVVPSWRGTYPNYSMLIPKRGALLSVPKVQLKDAIRLIIAMGGKGLAARLRMNGMASLAVSGIIHNGASTTTTIPAKGSAKIAFNAGYLLDLCDRVGDIMELRTTSPGSPGVVRINGSTHILMPMAVAW